MGHSTSSVELRHTMLSMLQSTSMCQKPQEKPSILWYIFPIAPMIRDKMELKIHEYSKRSKGSSISIIQGINDMLCGIKYLPQGNLENVIIKRFAGFYTKRAEEIPVILKKPFKV